MFFIFHLFNFLFINIIISRIINTILFISNSFFRRSRLFINSKLHCKSSLINFPLFLRDIFVHNRFSFIFTWYLCPRSIFLYFYKISLPEIYFPSFLRDIFVRNLFSLIFTGYLCPKSIFLYFCMISLSVIYFHLFLITC